MCLTAGAKFRITDQDKRSPAEGRICPQRGAVHAIYSARQCGVHPHERNKANKVSRFRENARTEHRRRSRGAERLSGVMRRCGGMDARSVSNISNPQAQ